MSKRKSTKLTVVDGRTQDGFANFTARLGLGADNLLSQSTYTLETLSKNRIKLEAMYRSSWIVGMAVDVVAEDMTRSGISISGEIEPDKIQQMQSKLTRIGVWAGLLDLIKWGRLYGGSLAVLMIDGQDPATPLRLETVGQGQFSGLRVYDRWQLQPSQEAIIEDGPHAGLPESYTIISNPATGTVSNLRVHHSRVIRYIGIQLPLMQAITEQLWGASVVERIHDRLVSFDMATSGAANLVSRAYLRTVRIDRLREVLAAGGQAEQNMLKMFHHMRFVQSSEGITLLDKEDEFAAHSYTFAGLSDMLMQFGQQISGALGIPLVRLFGQSPAGLNSTGESDLRQYYDSIMAQQESRLRDGMLTILRVLFQSLFGEPAPEDLDFDFTPLWQESRKEKITMAAALATTIGAMFDSGLLDQATALRELSQASDYTNVFSNISDETIREAELTPPPEPALPSPLGTTQDPESASMSSSTVVDRVRAWLRG